MYKQTKIEFQCWPVWINLTLGPRYLGLYFGHFLPVIEIKSVKWYFYYKLKASVGCFGFEWLNYTKHHSWKNDPISRSYYWGLGEWRAMTEEEYNQWQAEMKDSATEEVKGEQAEIPEET